MRTIPSSFLNWANSLEISVGVKHPGGKLGGSICNEYNITTGEISSTYTLTRGNLEYVGGGPTTNQDDGLSLSGKLGGVKVDKFNNPVVGIGIGGSLNPAGVYIDENGVELKGFEIGARVSVGNSKLNVYAEISVVGGIYPGIPIADNSVPHAPVGQVSSMRPPRVFGAIPYVDATNALDVLGDHYDWSWYSALQDQYNDYSDPRDDVYGGDAGTADDGFGFGSEDYGDSSRGSSTSGSPGQFSHYSGGHPGIDGNYNGNGDSGGGSSSGGPSGGSSNGGGSSSGSSSSSSAGSSSSSSSGVSNGGWGGYGKPIVLDLDGDGDEIALQTGSQTYIDFDDDGFFERSAWAAPDDGILVIDLAEDGTARADGKISRTREIALALWDEDADSDLEGLKLGFDSNGDGVFDDRDDRFGEFRVWRDADSDGVADDGELRTLEEAGIRSIDLTSDGERLVLPDGTIVHGEIAFRKTDGETGKDADVAFRHGGIR